MRKSRTRKALTPASGQKKEMGPAAVVLNPAADKGQFAAFISYSRKDQEFVRHLEEALERSERRTWIDHGEVMPAEDWHTAIYSGIEAADNFVFVLSPDSLNSKVCADELSHAITHNKRLVPVLYREVDSLALPAPLDKLNWIFFRERDEFDSAFQTLCAALDTDLGYVRAHTRLLTRALEWESRGSDSSLMLRGKDLQEAEHWLIQASTQKSSKPTQQQTAYIIASRKAETRRQRVLLGAVLLGLAVAVTLAIFALISRQTAITQRRIAEERRAVALSRQLAVQSLNLLPGQVDLAMLLALEANRESNTTESQASLLGTLAYGPDVGAYLPSPAGDVESVAFSPDGRTLASGSGPNIILWDVRTHQAVGTPLTGHTGNVDTLAFSPDGRILASGSKDHSIILWDVNTHQKLGQSLAGHTDFVRSVAFSPDGKFIVSGGQDGKIIWWDLATRMPHAKPLTGHDGSGVFTVAFSPDGKILASGSRDKTIVLWDVATHQILNRLTTGEPVRSLAFSHDGKTLASTSNDSDIVLWDVATGRQGDRFLSGNGRGVSSVAFSPDDRLLASADNGGAVLVWDAATRQPISRPLTGSDNAIKSVAFSPDGTTLSWGGDNARIGLWEVSTRRRLGLGSESSSWLVAYSPDGRILATGNDKELLLWDVATLRLLRQPLSRHTNISQITFSPDGKWLAAYGNDYAEVWDASTPRGEVRGPIKVPGMSLDFSPDGKSLAVGDSEGIIAIYDLGTMEPRGEPLKGHDGPVSVLAYSSDGRSLVSAGRDATLRVWDVVARKPLIPPLTGHDGAVWGMTLSRDGSTLASGSIDNTVRLWDAASGKQLAVLLGHAALCEDLAFSPDGKVLASCSADGICILWEVPTRQLLVKFHVEPEADSQSGVAFSVDGKTLATGSSDVTLWDVSLDSWKARACKIANRNLTALEWTKYLGDEQRRKTCPDLPLP